MQHPTYVLQLVQCKSVMQIACYSCSPMKQPVCISCRLRNGFEETLQQLFNKTVCTDAVCLEFQHIGGCIYLQGGAGADRGRRGGFNSQQGLTNGTSNGGAGDTVRRTRKL